MKGRLHVLCYHRVLPAADRGGVGRPYFTRGTAIREETFRAHLRALRANFALFREDDVLSWLAGERVLDRDACWITFDDGYVDLVERVAPMLSDAGVPAAAFIPTAILSPRRLLPADRWYSALGSARRRRGTLAGFGSESWKFDLDRPADYARFIDGPEKRHFLEAAPRVQEELLSGLVHAIDGTPPAEGQERMYVDAADLAHLVRAGWTIGSHGVSHALLPRRDSADIDRELVDSRAKLVDLGVPRPRAFAYPDGAWTAAVAAKVEASGYELAVTLDAGTSHVGARFWLPRVLPQDDPAWVERTLLAKEGQLRGRRVNDSGRHDSAASPSRRPRS